MVVKRVGEKISRLSTATVGYCILFGLLFWYLLYIYSLVPLDNVTMSGIGYRVFGTIKSLSMDLGLRISHVSYPYNQPLITGLPYLLPAALLAKVFNLNVFLASNIVIAGYLLISYVVFLLMLRQLTGNKLLSLLVPVVFYSMPIVVGNSSYGPMMVGFLLLPFYVGAFLYAVKLNHLGGYLLLLFVFAFALFMDGYSFVFIVFIAMTFTLAGRVFDFPGQYRVHFFRLLSAIVISIVLYKLYIPSIITANHMPLDFFRGQGVDLITMVVPQQRTFMLTHLLSYGASDNPLSFFTDGEMVYHSFFGFCFMLALGVVVSMTLRKKIAVDKGVVLLLVALIMGSLLFALGPSLKINDRNPEVEQRITFNSYLMSEEQATFTFPYQKLFVKLPAIKSMRATHRWLLVTYFTLLVLLSYLMAKAIDLSGDKKSGLLYPVLLLLMIVELMPNVAGSRAGIQANKESFEFTDRHIVKPLKQLLPKDSVVAFFSTENDYMANYICSNAAIKCLNVGGDKNILLAQKHWPMPFRAVREEKNLKENFHALLKYSGVDAVILPKFNLRWDSYSKQILGVDLEKYNRQYRTFKDTELFTLTDSDYFLILQLKEE